MAIVDEGKRRYAVVGLGAVGGYYGVWLAAAGHEVHGVARSDATHVRRHGLVVESPEGDLHLAPDDLPVHASTTEVPEVDVVLLATKALDQAEAAGLLAPLIGDGTIVVALQNGLGVEAPLAAALPRARVLGGMCFVCVNKVGPGHVRHLDHGSVLVGEHRADGPAGVTPAVQAVVDDLRAAGVAARPVDDLATGRWRKLVWNVPYNGLSVVLDAGTDALMADPSTRSLVEALMVEVVGAAAACGHTVDRSFVDEMLRTTDEMTPYATSMRLDHDAGRPLEVEAIYTRPIAEAAAHGFAMVLTAVLEQQLRFLDRRRRGVSAGRDTSAATRP